MNKLILPKIIILFKILPKMILLPKIPLKYRPRLILLKIKAKLILLKIILFRTLQDLNSSRIIINLNNKPLWQARDSIYKMNLMKKKNPLL